MSRLHGLRADADSPIQAHPTADIKCAATGLQLQSQHFLGIRRLLSQFQRLGPMEHGSLNFSKAGHAGSATMPAGSGQSAKTCANVSNME